MLQSLSKRGGLRHQSSTPAGNSIRPCRVCVRTGVAATDKAEQTVLIASPQQLPPNLRNAVAVLEAPNPAAPGGTTHVYLLAVSHVSQKSCQQVRELIHLVKPEVVLVELCKDRGSLLVEEEPDKLDGTWHCRKVGFEGLPEKSGWPSADELRNLLLTRPGQPITTGDIEADVERLLSTGLFSRARPKADAGSRSDAPMFGVVRPEEEEGSEASSGSSSSSGDEIGLQLIPPLGGVKFIVEERVVPPVTSMSVRLDSSLKGGPVSQEVLEAAAQEAMAEADATAAAAAEASSSNADDTKDGEKKDKDNTANGLGHYLAARAKLAAAFPDPDAVVVEFRGVEDGRVEAVVRARLPSDSAYLSGLEESAQGGEGLGIISFIPARTSVQISPGMLLPAEATERLSAARAARQAERVVRAGEDWEQKTEVTPWTPADIQSPAATPLPSNPLLDIFGAVVTSSYSKLQSKAGEASGVSSGEAWQVAMQAATEVGAQQFILGDMPATITMRHLSSAMITPTSGRLLAALGVISAGVAAAVNHAAAQLLPTDMAVAAGSTAAVAGDGAAVAVGLAAAVAVMWPLLGPYLEVWKFGGMSGEEVEATVDIKEPIQSNLDTPMFFFGEDALVKWPGALKPVIEERDTFMARVAAAAASSKPCAAPAFVASTLPSGQLVWRYMMAEDGPAGSAPRGLGDGAYAPLAGPKAVVGVIGSAHVRGICKQWEESVKQAGQVEDLLKV